MNTWYTWQSFSSLPISVREHRKRRPVLKFPAAEENLGDRKEPVSYTHLDVYKRQGYTFLDFLNRYRISQAVKLLKKQEYRIYEIAEMVGFSDYKYFIKVFKKYAGCSPNKFLESYR